MRNPWVTRATTPAQGTTLSIYKGHTSGVNDLAWSPDSTRIASADFTTLRVWNVATNQEHFIQQTHNAQETSNASTVATLAWSPNGMHLAIPDNPYMATSSVFILDAQTGKKLVTCTISDVVQVANDYYIFQIAWSPDSSQIAVAGDMDVKICDTQTGQKLLTYPAQPPASGRQPSFAVAWSPDGGTIASAAANPGHSVQFPRDAQRVFSKP